MSGYRFIMKHVCIGVVLLMGLNGCTGNTGPHADNRTAGEPKDPPSTGVSISGYARFGIEKGP